MMLLVHIEFNINTLENLGNKIEFKNPISVNTNLLIAIPGKFLVCKS